MKSKFETRKRKLLRTVFGTLSFSSALFVFQACYGTPADFGMDVSIEGKITSSATNLPIKGIKVSIENQPQYEITDQEGRFKIYVSKDTVYHVVIEDYDQAKDGNYERKDTLITLVGQTTELNVSLDVR